MAPLPAVSDVLRLTLTGTLGGDTNVLNRLFVQMYAPAGGASALTTCLTSIATAWNTDLAPLFPNDFTLTGVGAEDLTSSTSIVGNVSVSHAGTRSGNALAAGQAAVVRFHVARRYRGGHPRAYLPCLTNTDLATAQTWQPASIAALQSAWTTFMGAVETAVGIFCGVSAPDHVNVSYYAGFTNRTYPSGRIYPVPTRRSTPVVDTVSSYSVNPHVGSQRRRNQTP